MNISKLYDFFLENPKICTDSRKAEQGALFFALKGDNFNGNAYAEIALEKCAYAIVDEEEFAKNEKCILVPDVLETLQSLAKYHRKRLGTPIIAITGTNGKTTTKELVAAVLSKKFKVAYTQGNFNNHIGVPLTLLKMTRDDEFGVIEMGANHIGEIALLCNIAAPDFGIITNVGRAHLEGFGSIEGVRKAKGELYDYLYENDGLVFINDDNEILSDMNPPHDSILYGTKGFTHCQGKILESDLFLKFAWYDTKDLEQDVVELDWDKCEKVVFTNLVGEYNLENALAAVCVGNNFDISAEEIKDAIESFYPKNNRSQLTKTENNTLLLDGYNANPSSMKVAIDNFSTLKLDHKTLILGDMLELGKAAIREHGVIVGLLQQLDFENVFLVGENFYQYNGTEGIVTFENVDEICRYLEGNKQKGKSILIKGSRGIQLEKVLDYL